MPCLPPSSFSLVSTCAASSSAPLSATMSPLREFEVQIFGLHPAPFPATRSSATCLPRLRRRGLPDGGLRRRCAAGWRPSNTGEPPCLVLHVDRDAVLLGIGHQFLARQQIPLAPRRDDLDVGLQRIGAQFEAHLVVALAGGAVRRWRRRRSRWRSRSGAWRSADARSRCRAGIRLRTRCWRGTSGTRNRARIPRAGRR